MITGSPTTSNPPTQMASGSPSFTLVSSPSLAPAPLLAQPAVPTMQGLGMTTPQLPPMVNSPPTVPVPSVSPAATSPQAGTIGLKQRLKTYQCIYEFSCNHRFSPLYL